jgi:hypothetical protein
MSGPARATQGAQFEALAATLRGCETVVQYASTPTHGGPAFKVSSDFTPPCRNATQISEEAAATGQSNPGDQIAACSVDVELFDDEWNVTAWSCSR